MGQFEVLKKIQEIELDALKEFNKICKENNLMFFLRGGSVMGAVKYQGFIPWDDDAVSYTHLTLPTRTVV